MVLWMESRREFSDSSDPSLMDLQPAELVFVQCCGSLLWLMKMSKKKLLQRLCAGRGWRSTENDADADGKELIHRCNLSEEAKNRYTQLFAYQSEGLSHNI